MSILSLLVLLISCRNPIWQDETETTWQVMLEDLEGTLLSVYAPSDTDIWAVGSDPGDDLGSYVFHSTDGEDFERLDAGAEGIMWWADGDDEGNVWLVGEGGTVRRWTEAGGFETFDTPSQATLFSIFALAPDNVWACGVDQTAVSSGAAIWHYDGVEWSEDPDDPGQLIPGQTPNKVYARHSEDLWIVGGTDVGLHRTEAGWEAIDVGTDTWLTTIHGNQNLIVAVGGTTKGGITENTGSGFHEVDFQDVPLMNLAGVAVYEDDTAVAAGWWGSLWERRQGRWHSLEEEAPAVREDYHGVAITPSGDVWVAGGLFNSFPLRDGVLVKGRLTGF